MDSEYSRRNDSQPGKPTIYTPEPAEQDIVGAGGLRSLTFKALKKGETEITLAYERSYENSAIETLVYNVTVK